MASYVIAIIWWISSRLYEILYFILLSVLILHHLYFSLSMRSMSDKCIDEGTMGKMRRHILSFFNLNFSLTKQKEKQRTWNHLEFWIVSLTTTNESNVYSKIIKSCVLIFSEILWIPKFKMYIKYTFFEIVLLRLLKHSC